MDSISNVEELKELLQEIDVNNPNWAFNFLKIKDIKDHYRIDGKPLNGSGVKVAVIDNGIVASSHCHPQFANRNVQKLDIIGEKADKAICYIKDMTCKKKIRALKHFEFNVNENYNGKANFHGSHMASIIGGNDGIASGCDLLILNVHDQILRPKYLPLAIYYAMSQGANIINISQDAADCSSELRSAVRCAYDNHVLIVCGSGNTFTESLLSLEFPGAYQKTFAVGGYRMIEKNDKKEFDFYVDGDRGKLLDFMAPAVGIKSPLNGKRNLKGTSCAAAIISGILALFLQRYRFEKNIKGFPSYRDVKKHLVHRAFHPNEENHIDGDHNEDWGYGIIHPLSLFDCFKHEHE